MDDYEDILDIITFVLQGDPLEVKCLTNTSLIYDYLDKLKPDLVLMDVNLGSSDGREVCEEIKGNPDYEHVKIILMSAMNDGWKEFGCKADAKIDKPFEIDHLRNLILSQLSLPFTEM